MTPPLCPDTREERDHPDILPCVAREGGCYPNVDISIWLRSAKQIFFAGW